MSDFMAAAGSAADEAGRKRAQRRRVCVIPLMGKAEAGKTMFIDTCTGREDLTPFRNMRERTREIQESKIYPIGRKGKPVFFVEMPGFRNEPPTDSDILRHIAKFLIRSYENFNMSGVVYLYDSSTQYDPTILSYENNILRAILGTECYSHLLLIVNKYRPTPESVRQVSHLDTVWRDFIANNATRELNPAPVGDSRNIVQRLLEKDGALTLALQKELIEDKKYLQETQAGKAVAGRLKQEIRRVKQETKGLPRTVLKNDPQRVSLRAQLADIERELKTWERCRDMKDDLEAWPERIRKKRFFGH